MHMHSLNLLASMRMLSQQKDFRMHVKPVLLIFGGVFGTLWR